MFFQMSTLRFSVVSYCWYICDDYMRVNEFMSHLSFAQFAWIIMSEISILTSLLDFKRTVKEDLLSVIKCNE